MTISTDATSGGGPVFGPPSQPGPAVPGDAPPRSAYRALLSNHNYRLWFLSAFASGLGDWTGLVALQVLVVQLTDPGSQLALFALSGIMMAKLLPSIIVGPVAGVLADRYDRKRLMVVTNLSRGAIFVIIAFSGDVWAVFALTFLVECLTLMFISAKDASLPTIVRRDQLQAASQLNLLATFGPFPLGAAIASLMIPVAAAVGLGQENAALLALLLNGVTFFASAALLSRLVLPAHGRGALTDERTASPKGLLAELREGLTFIRDLPVVRALITGVVGVFFGAGVIVALGPEFVRQSLGGAETDWFITMASVGVGLAIGLASVPLLTRHLRRERVFPVTLLATGVIATAIATMRTLSGTLVLALGLGAAVGMSVVLGYTLLQEHTEDHVRGKTFAAFYTTTRISMFAALALAPAAAGVIVTGSIVLRDVAVQASGIRIMIFLAGLVVTASALWTLNSMWRSLRGGHGGHGGPGPVTLSQFASPHTAGVFIAVEGVEGSGKSTQVARLADALRAEGHDVVVTREPGGPPVAERIRGVLLDPGSGPMSAHTEALLLAAARAEHVRTVILPALDAGKVVLCDRFIDSSLAYQGHARGLGENDVFEINRWALGGLMPDATVLLHLDAGEGLGRTTARDAARRHLQPAEIDPAPAGDRMENEGEEFHRAVAEGYLRLARRERHRFVVLDATGTPDEVARQVRSGLHAWLPLPGDHGGLGSPGTSDAAGPDTEVG